MRHVLDAFVLHGFERDERLAREVRALEGEDHVHRAARILCGECGGSGDLVALVIEGRCTRGLVHEDAGCRVLVARDEAGVGDGVDDGEVVSRLALVGRAVGIGRRGLHGLGHVLELVGVGLRHGSRLVPLDHALVVHLEVGDAGVAFLVEVGDYVAFRRLELLDVVASVLGVGERYLALVIGHELLVEGALVVPHAELRPG